MSKEITALNDIASQLVDSAYTVHKTLGPGLLERIYETCLHHELTKRGIRVERQVALPVKYDDIVFDEGLRLDLLVENKIICELKAVDNVHPVWHAQILSQLKLSGLRLGFLINFNEKNIGRGIKRFIL